MDEVESLGRCVAAIEQGYMQQYDRRRGL